MVDTGVNKVTCTTENLVLLRKPPIATKGKGDERPTCRRENSTTTKLSPSFQPVSDTKQTTCHSTARPFIFHRRPSKPTLTSQKTPTGSTENTSLNKKSHPLVENASLNDCKQCGSKAKPGFSEMSGSNRRLFITQDITDKPSLHKPHLRPASAHVLGERKKSQTEAECFISTIASKEENKKQRPASAHVSGNVSKMDVKVAIKKQRPASAHVSGNVSKLDMKLETKKPRPASAHVSGIVSKVDVKVETKKPRPASAHVSGIVSQVDVKVETKKPRPASAHVARNVSKVDIEPMVYGLADHRRVSGSQTDLASAGQLCLYRLCTDQKKDERTTKQASPQKDTSMPRRLHLLQPWLTDLSSDSSGVTPRNCLVFVPSLQVDEGTLPMVPPVQLATDQLPYKYKIVEPEPWCPKKYDHPWRQQPVSAWQCNHGTHRPTMPRLPSLVKIYSEEGQLLHMRYSGKRTANIVRKEIQELEDLLKGGVGSRDGCSIVVQYQAEISHLQTMLNRTKGRVEEIERRVHEKLLLKAPPPVEVEPQDSFGLKAFYRRHEEVIAEIILQRDLCVKELAAIEESLDLDTDRKHFKRRMQMEGQSEDKVKEHVNSDHWNNTE